MADLNPDWIGQSYQAIVTQRGYGLNETEVLELLRDCAEQLQPLHEQGEIHGDIYWDTLKLNENCRCVLGPPSEFSLDSAPSQDLSDLALAAIQILTGKTKGHLTQELSELAWKEECDISEPLADLLSKMLASDDSGSPELKTANQLSDALNMLASIPSGSDSSSIGYRDFPSELPPLSEASQETNEFQQDEDTRGAFFEADQETEEQEALETLVSTKPQPPHSSISTSIIFSFLALGALGLLYLITVRLFSQFQEPQEAQAKQYIEHINNAQQMYYSDNHSFSEIISSLDLGDHQPPDGYVYGIYQPHPYLVVHTGNPQEKSDKSFAGFVYLVQNDNGDITTQSLLCQTMKPNQVASVDFRILGNEDESTSTQCPEGMISVDEGPTFIAVNGTVLTPSTITKPLPSISLGSTSSPSSSSTPSPDPTPLSTPSPQPSPDPTPLSTPSPQPSPAHVTNPFIHESFPKPGCGDSLPANDADFPVNFYPVYVNPGDRNLQAIRARFCGDAYEMTKKDSGDKAIQVASFRSQEQAQWFAEFLKSEFGSGEVGPPTVINTP